MIVNSKIKHKSRTKMAVIRNLVFEFILCFWNLSDFILVHCYMNLWESTLHMQYQHKVQHKIDYTTLEVSKKSFMTNNLQLHTKNIQNYYNEKCT